MVKDDKQQASELRVREIGQDDLHFSTSQEAAEYLSTHRRNKHVTVCYTSSKTGLMRNLFVTVDANGQLYKSYGNQEQVTL